MRSAPASLVPRAARALLAAVALLVPAAGPAPAAPPQEARQAVEEVADLLAGTFDSSAQAAADPEHFRAVRIVAVRVPKSRLGSPVLYVEQALVSSPGRPYRQRFLRIEEGRDGSVLARVFEPKDLAGVRGKWREPEDLAVFGERDVTELARCTVALTRKGETWEGGTSGRGCPSALDGARYATSRVTLLPDRMDSWDQGFDGSGRQVWGPTSGPSIFRVVSRGTPGEAAAAAVPAAAATATATATTDTAPAAPTPTVISAPPAAVPVPTASASAPRDAAGPAAVVVRLGLSETAIPESRLEALKVEKRTLKREGRPGETEEVVGVALRELLAAAGVPVVGDAALRELARSAVVVRGDGAEVALYSGMETLASGGPLLVTHRDGKALDPARGLPLASGDGPGPRRVAHVRSIELRPLPEPAGR